MIWIPSFIALLLVGVDAYFRKNNFIFWALFSFILWPVFVPIYFSKRNLKSGETREGGTAWNILKNFAITWTMSMLMIGILFIVNMSKLSPNGVGLVFGLVVISLIWFLPMIFALILGLFLKKSSIVEKGPSGKLNSIVA